MDTDQPHIPGQLNPLFAALVGDLFPTDPAWHDGKTLTASEVSTALAEGSPTGVAYAQALLHEVYRMVREPHRKKAPHANSLDVTASARDMFTPMYQALKPTAVVRKTMSGNWTAAYMLELLQQERLDDANQHLRSLLYVARDILKFRAED